MAISKKKAAKAKKAAPLAKRTTVPKMKRPPAMSSQGFVGSPPEQTGWFATNHLCFKGGKLYQLFKGGITEEYPEARFHWMPVLQMKKA